MSGFQARMLALAGLACCSGRGDIKPRPAQSTAARTDSVAAADQAARRKLDEGRWLLLGGDCGAAKAAFEIASNQPTTRSSALLGLAEAEFQLGGFAAAESLATKAVAEGGGVRARVVLGNIRLKLGDDRGAVRSYESALALDGGNQEARRNLAVARRRGARRR